MIQRIQSIYLFFITVLAVMFLTGNILEFSSPSGGILLKASGIKGFSPGFTFTIFTALSYAVPVLSVAAILLYKKRRIQLRLATILAAILLIIITLLVYYALSVIHGTGAEFLPRINAILPVIMLLLVYLAYKGIKKDEELVKSYDRLR